MTSVDCPDNFFLKHESSIFRSVIQPLCGFSVMEQVRLCTVCSMEIRGSIHMAEKPLENPPETTGTVVAHQAGGTPREVRPWAP